MGYYNNIQAPLLSIQHMSSYYNPIDHTILYLHPLRFARNQLLDFRFSSLKGSSNEKNLIQDLILDIVLALAFSQRLTLGGDTTEDS